MKLISLDALVAEIENYISNYKEIVAKTDRKDSTWVDSVSMIEAKIDVLKHFLSFLVTLEVKEVDLIIHTIIAECCDWLAMNTELSHGEIEGCRNLMLTVKDEQLKAQKGEEI